MNEVENKHELKARQLPEAELKPGEELLAYTQSQSAGFITRKILYFCSFWLKNQGYICPKATSEDKISPPDTF
jgi:hypothetical protein